MSQIPRDVVPDMPDRIIAATALSNSLPLVTRDLKIRALTTIQTRRVKLLTKQGKS